MKSLIALAVLFNAIYAQSNTGSVITLTGSNSASATGADYATGTYVDYDTTYTLNTDNSYLTLTGTLNATATSQPRNETITTNGTVLVTSSATQTILSGRPRNSTTTTDGTNTSAAARPTNTTPCNGWPEFCNRKYSNISMVAAHNSPFLIAGNIASNQALPVTSQLNDGVRMLQFQVHRPNSTGLYLCHTSCDLLNAGLLVDYLTTVRQWLDENPYEVLTILMGNYDVLTPQNFTAPIIDSGLIRYVYTPPSVPMTLEQWPTLGEMILTNKRLVVMLDYEADQTEIPWLLDEFGQMWETPFSPTDPAFPCIVNRPPDQNRNTSSNRMYMANHNLNIDVSIAGFSLLIPAFTSLNVTNAVEGYGSLGNAVDNCTTSWDRPPNFLLVDFYNIGSFNGSVFQVAATANDVDYNRASCCDTDGNVSNAAIRAEALSKSTVAIVLGVVALMFAL